jgi:hypothetical protein
LQNRRSDRLPSKREIIQDSERRGIELTKKRGSKLQCRWVDAASAFGQGREGRRWILRKNGTKNEEVSIEDIPFGEAEDEHDTYEIVGHDFKSGDIETIDYARTIEGARDKVKRFLKKNPCGQYG